MAKRKTLLDELHKEVAANPVMNEVYQRELARLELANQILEARQRANLSQAQLAERIGTKQPAIARMERAGSASYTVSTLLKIATATGATLKVELVPTARVAKRTQGR